MLIIIRLVLELSYTKVKCLIYCEVCECTDNFIQWKNRVRTMTFGFRFCSVRYGVWFSSVSVLAHFLLSDSGSVRFLAKLGFLFGSFWLGSGYFPISSCDEPHKPSLTGGGWLWGRTVGHSAGRDLSLLIFATPWALERGSTGKWRQSRRRCWRW